MWALLLLLYRYEVPLAVAGLVLVRWLPALISSSSPKPAVPPPPPVPRTAKLLLLLSSLYHLYRLVFPPYDLFIHNNLEILAQNTLLRDALLRQPLHSPPGDHSPLLDLLLTRLKVLDNRYLYARLGHRPLLECLWCTHPLDYFLFALPSILLPYLCEALVLGMLGWRAVGGSWAERRTERWRGIMAWTLSGAAVAEIGVKWGWEVVAVQGDCAHVSSILSIIYTRELQLIRFGIGCASDTHYPVFIPPLASHPIRPSSRPFPVVASYTSVRIGHYAVPDVSPVHSALHVCDACGHIAVPTTTCGRAGDKQERG